MKIYVAGPVTGIINYKEPFNKAVAELQEKGHIVINPSVLPDGLGSHETYMKICLAMLDTADAIYMLQGWENSKGAKIEYDYAKQRGKSIHYQVPVIEFTCNAKITEVAKQLAKKAREDIHRKWPIQEEEKQEQQPKRITVICQREDDLENIRSVLSNYCPLQADYPEFCGEDADCGICIEDNIDFELEENQ